MFQLSGQHRGAPRCSWLALLAIASVAAAYAQVGAAPSGFKRRTPFEPDQKVLNFHGKVVLDDGSAPLGEVAIERVCGTYVYKEGVTNKSGQYSVQLGQNQTVVLDASTNGATVNANTASAAGLTSSLSPNAMWDCELRASLVGYRSESVMLSQLRNLDAGEMDFVLHYVGHIDGVTTSATTGLAPNSAKKAFKEGMKAAQRDDLDQAEQRLRDAVKEYPRFAEAWYNLGLVYENQKEFEDARKAYQKAIEADGSYVNPHDRLYHIAEAGQQWEDVERITARVLSLNPYDFADAYYYNAVAQLELGNLPEAERSAREATQVTGAKFDPRSHYVLGMALGRQAKFEGAAAEMRAYLAVVPNAGNRELVERLIATADSEVAKTRQ